MIDPRDVSYFKQPISSEHVHKISRGLEILDYLTIYPDETILEKMVEKGITPSEPRKRVEVMNFEGKELRYNVTLVSRINGEDFVVGGSYPHSRLMQIEADAKKISGQFRRVDD